MAAPLRSDFSLNYDASLEAYDITCSWGHSAKVSKLAVGMVLDRSELQRAVDMNCPQCHSRGGNKAQSSLTRWPEGAEL